MLSQLDSIPQQGVYPDGWGESILFTLTLVRPLTFPTTTQNQNYRIIEQFGLEGTFKAHLVHPSCSEQGHLPLDQVAQSLIQPDLKCYQGWGIHNFAGQPVALFHHPHCKKFLPYVQSKSTFF